MNFLNLSLKSNIHRYKRDRALGPASGSLTIRSVYDSVFNTTKITSTITNTSDPHYAPAITGWGFDTQPNTERLDWDLRANKWTGAGFLQESLKDKWNLDLLSDAQAAQGNTKFKVDLIANTDKGINYGLYNPAIVTDSIAGLATGANPRYTEAILTVTLKGKVNAVFNSDGMSMSNPDPNNASPYLRLQNTGPNGQSSLKLSATQLISTPNGDPVPGTAEVPEPATLAIWSLGLGLVGLVRLRRKA